jgi:hypothetical protein
MTPDDPIRPPAPHPCGSCPYRQDVPSGVWDEGEYDKLPEYDEPTGNQPIGVFMCHQADGRVCAGWAGCHDMEENLAVRLSVATGRMDDKTYEALLDYETPTPLWETGGEAASHGVENLFDPDEDAQRVMDKLRSKRERT